MKDELTDDLLRVRIRCLLLLRQLPAGNALQRRIALGRGRICAACDRKIEREHVEVVLHFADSPKNSGLQFHGACEWAWNAERTGKEVRAALGAA